MSGHVIGVPVQVELITFVKNWETLEICWRTVGENEIIYTNNYFAWYKPRCVVLLIIFVVFLNCLILFGIKVLQ